MFALAFSANNDNLYAVAAIVIIIAGILIILGRRSL
jgi:hypothetical protein